MKNKIIEIIESYSKNPITNILYESDFPKVADEILALHEAELAETWERGMSAGHKLGIKHAQERPQSASEPCYCEKCVGENDMSFEEDVPEDCDCKCCKPELWYLDKERGYIWFKKSSLMQRTGDEVI